MKNKITSAVGAIIISTATAFVVRQGVKILMERRMEQELDIEQEVLEESE
mgnify:CR=1 FL=1